MCIQTAFHNCKAPAKWSQHAERLVTDFFAGAIIETRKSGEIKRSSYLRLPPFIVQTVDSEKTVTARPLFEFSFFKPIWLASKLAEDRNKGDHILTGQDKGKHDNIKGKEYLFWALHKYFDSFSSKYS